MTNFIYPIIFDFTKETNVSRWKILDDVVMGGRSKGSFKINKDGHGQFYGDISLENNGGFSSVRYRTIIERLSLSDTIEIRLKGDGKNYQFRVKHNLGAYYSYIYPFQTSGEWETIKIPLNQMYPYFRGRKLRSPNFSHTTIEEVTFLISNKKAEKFELLLDKIEIM
ncbi:MAG: CIA30 family protein [Bacteroidota bacterium]